MTLLFTRVKGPDEDKWEKLLGIINHLQEKRDDKLIIKINDITTADWYADAYFAVHADIKSHTGGVVTMGKLSIKKFQ